MQFLFPSFLWALAALSVPIAIHLFNFRRTKRIYFSNVSFLKNIEIQTSSFRKLKHWLILAARLLFLLFLVLAFAQPFIPARNNSNVSGIQGGLNSLYLDNSLSMQNTSENKQYLDLAIGKMDELLTLFKQSPSIQLITNDFSGEEQAIANGTKIKDRLTSIHFANQSRSLESVYQRQQNLAQKHQHLTGNQYYWFSDFQKSTSGNLSKIKIDSSSKLYLVPVQGKKQQNVFADSVWLASPFIREMQNNVLYVKVYNSGNEAVEKLPIKLFLDEKQASTASVNINSDGSSTAKFNFTLKDKGFHKGRISFDDQPITFDNDYFFVLNASPHIQVLHLYQEKSNLDYIQKVFDNDSLFQYKAFPASNVDVGQFNRANLIVLEGITQITASFQANIEKFVQNGGSILIIPPQKPDISGYTQLLNSFKVQINQVKNEAISAQNQVALIEPNKQHPFFADVFEQSNLQGLVNTPQIQSVWTWSGLGDKILTFKNNQNYLSSTQSGKGKVYLCAAPLDKNFGNFAEHAFFVPVMFKIASLSVKQERTAYHFNENSISLDIPDLQKNTIYKLVYKSEKKKGTEIIPIQKSVENTLTFELPKSIQSTDNQNIESGYYELTANGKVVKLLAFNHDNDESKMDFYSPEELRNIFSNRKNVQIFDNILDNDFIKTFEESNVGTSLWKYCIILSLLFLLIEILLIKFMKN